MKMIVLLLTSILIGRDIQGQNLQGIWQMKIKDKLLAGTRDLWIYIDNDSDSIYTGHTVTISSTSFGASPDTVVAQLRGHADKRKQKIYLEEYKVVQSKRKFSGGLEKFKLTYSGRKQKYYLKGVAESPPLQFPLETNQEKVSIETSKPQRIYVEFSKIEG